MGLLAEIYGVFGLGYSIALVKLNQGDFSRTDVAFMVATLAFVGLSIGSFVNQLLVMPCGYKWRFFWKSLARGLFGPLLSLLYYPILFGCSGCSGCSGCLKTALTFSNEAHNGVERTRQKDIFELGSDARLYLTTRDLLRYENEWGYERLVGEIWVRVRFAADFHVDPHFRKLETSDWSENLLLQYKHGPGIINCPYIIATILPDEGGANAPRQGNENAPGQGNCVRCSCRTCLCICQDLESSSALDIPGTPTRTPPQTVPPSQNPPVRYEVTITRRRAICRIRRWAICCCFPGWTWNLECTVVRQWTLCQIHQYLLCLDVWGNHPKQGIWKPEKQTCCSGCSPCCNACYTNQLFRYCYRHDELIEAIGEGKRVTSRPNDATWYTVVWRRISCVFCCGNHEQMDF